MKLTGELKEKVEKAESAAEAKEIIEAAGVELTDDEVEAVAGGMGSFASRQASKKTTKPNL